MPAPLTDLHYEILDLVADEDESTAAALQTLHHPSASPFSEQALALDFIGLDAVFEELQAHGLVEPKFEVTDGVQRPRPGVTYTWWSMTEKGRRAWDLWDAAQPD